MPPPYRPLSPNDRTYSHGSNPVPAFNSLNISSSHPSRDAPLYFGMIFTRKTVAETSPPLWEEHELHETQEDLGKRLSKGKSKSVDYSGQDMNNAAKRDQVDRVIKRKNREYPGYVYTLRMLLLETKKTPQGKKISTKMTIILQRQPTTKAQLKSKFDRQTAQGLYGDDDVGYRDDDLYGDAGITGIQYQPHDQHNRSQNMPIHPPEHYFPSPPPPPPPAYSGLQFPASPHAHQGEEPRFQMPHHEGGRFDGPQFNNVSSPLQDPHVSFEEQQKHDGLGGHHSDTQGSQGRPNISCTRNGAGHHPIIQEEYPQPRSGVEHHHHTIQEEYPPSGVGHHPINQEEYPRPRSGVGHQTNIQDEYNLRPRSGAGHLPNMRGENNNPPPFSGAGDCFDGRNHPNAHPNGHTEQRFDGNEEFLNSPRGGGGLQFEEFQGNQPHLHSQSKQNRSGDTFGVYGAGRDTDRKVHRDSGFFSGGSSDGGRSYSRNDQNSRKTYAESRGNTTYSKGHQPGYRKDNHHSRNRSKDQDSDSNWNRRRDSHQSLGSASDQYESDHNGRTASHTKNRHRQTRRNSSRRMNKEYSDLRSNQYLTSSEDSDRYSDDDSFHSSRGFVSPPTFRRSKQMSDIRFHNPRDLLDILNECSHEQKRREEKKLRAKKEGIMRHVGKSRLDRELEETRNSRETKGRRSSGGKLPRSSWTTPRQSDRYY